MTTASPSGIAATPRDTAIYAKHQWKSSMVDLQIYLEIIDRTLYPATMRRIIEMSYIDQPHEYTYDCYNFCQHVAEVVQFLL